MSAKQLGQEREYLLAFMLEPLDKGDQFIGWPLHITLVPWFRTDYGSEHVTRDIEKAASGIDQFTVTGIMRSMLGGQRNVPVTDVASSDLHDLHRALLTVFENDAYSLSDSKYTGVNYRPHVTKKGNAEFKPGHVILFDSVYLVSAPLKNPRTRTKTVIARIVLDGHETAT